jgi:hypothetical protein
MASWWRVVALYHVSQSCFLWCAIRRRCPLLPLIVNIAYYSICHTVQQTSILLTEVPLTKLSGIVPVLQIMPVQRTVLGQYICVSRVIRAVKDQFSLPFPEQRGLNQAQIAVSMLALIHSIILTTKTDLLVLQAGVCWDKSREESSKCQRSSKCRSRIEVCTKS